jgi:hypothetical protein
MGVSSTHFKHSTKMEMSGFIHVPAALPRGKKTLCTYCVECGLGTIAGLDVSEPVTLPQLSSLSLPSALSRLSLPGGHKPNFGQEKRKTCGRFRIFIASLRTPLWSSGQSFWLQIQRSRVRFPELPDFICSSGSGTGSTQPREVN